MMRFVTGNLLRGGLALALWLAAGASAPHVLAADGADLIWTKHSFSPGDEWTAYTDHGYYAYPISSDKGGVYHYWDKWLDAYIYEQFIGKLALEDGSEAFNTSLGVSNFSPFVPPYHEFFVNDSALLNNSSQ